MLERHSHFHLKESMVHPNILELLPPHKVESRYCNRTAYALCIAYQPHVYHTLTYANRWNYKYTRHGTAHTQGKSHIKNSFLLLHASFTKITPDIVVVCGICWVCLWSIGYETSNRIDERARCHNIFMKNMGETN